MGVGLAFAAALLAAGLLALDYQEPSGGQRPGQRHAVPSGALDRDRDPGSGRYLSDGVQQLREPGAVVADPHRGDRPADDIGDLHLVGIAVRVDPDDGIYYFCEHDHAASCLLPGSGPTSAPAWAESPGGISVTGHASWRTGF